MNPPSCTDLEPHGLRGGFDLLDNLGLIIHWFSSQEEAERDLATTLLQSAQQHAPGRVADLLTPFVPLREWRNRLLWLSRFARAEADPKTFGFIRDALRAGVFDDESGSLLPIFWVAAHGLPTSQSERASELLTAVLEPSGEESTAARIDRRLPERDYYASLYLEELARANPRVYTEAALPTIVGVLAETGGDPAMDGVHANDPWAHQYYGRRPSDKPSHTLYSEQDAALRALAKSKPHSFRRFARELQRLLDYASARFLLYRGWAANPAIFSTDAFETLASEPSPFRCGYLDQPYWETRQLLSGIQHYLAESQVEELQSRILAYVPQWERSIPGRDERGHAQFVLLDAIDSDKLTPKAAEHLAVLRRKFGDEVRSPSGIRVGQVRSPVPDQAAKRMSDEAWLAALQTYDRDESRELLKGGAIELSRILETETKSDPQRFAALARRFPPGINSHYVDAILRGLADASRQISSEAVFEAIRHFFSLPERPGGRWMARPLARVADQRVPDDILAAVTWWATLDPDPETDSWRPVTEGGGGYYGGDIYTAGINSVRGAAAEAVSALIWPDPSRVELLREACVGLATDRTLAVRSCGAVALRSLYRHDRDASLLLFERLVETEDALLATAPVEQFIATASRDGLPIVGPVIARMLVSAVPEVREAGGRQAALAALVRDDADELIKAALDPSRAAARLGVAQVAARNVADAEVGERCAEWLTNLFEDPEARVREEAAMWCASLDRTDFRELGGLASVFVESTAHAEHQHWLLAALDESTAPVAEVSMRAVERFLEVYGAEITNISRASAIDAPIAACLAVRVYSSVAGGSLRDRALELIERLLAARVSDAADFVRSSTA